MSHDLSIPRRIDPSARKQALWIGIFVLLSYAYFYPGGGWNQNTRFDLVRAIVERGTLSIDAYHQNTGDKALRDGHYYCDKAPGQPLLAVPAAVVTREAMRALGVSPLTPRSLVFLAYVCNLFSVALPVAAACALLFLIGLELGASRQGALFGALAMGLGTPLWAYATLFWGHGLAGACLLLAFYAALQLGRAAPGGELLWGSIVGLAAGWATVTEYQAAPASAILAAFAVARVWRSGWPRRLRVAGAVSAGALVCGAALLLYLHAAFGSILRTSYHYEAGDFPLMRRGLFGLTYPRIDIAFRLLFGLQRGVFVLAPATILAPFGLRLLGKRPTTRLAALAAAAIFIFYLVLNATYRDWTAGLSYGPRILGPGLPALCVGLAPAWDYLKPRSRRVAVALLCVSVLFALMAVSTTPQPPFAARVPIAQVFWPAFWSGHLSLERVTMLSPSDLSDAASHGAFNLGELLGLRGLTSLLPLLALWAFALVAGTMLAAKTGEPVRIRQAHRGS